MSIGFQSAMDTCPKMDKKIHACFASPAVIFFHSTRSLPLLVGRDDGLSKLGRKLLQELTMKSSDSKISKGGLDRVEVRCEILCGKGCCQST